MTKVCYCYSTSYLEMEKRVFPPAESIRVISGVPRIIIRHDYSRSRCTRRQQRGQVEGCEAPSHLRCQSTASEATGRRREAIEFHAATSSTPRRSSRGAHNASSRSVSGEEGKGETERGKGRRRQSWITTGARVLQAAEVTRRIAFPRETRRDHPRARRQARFP